MEKSCEFEILSPKFYVSYITEFGNSVSGSIDDIPKDAFGAFIDIYVPYLTKDNKEFALDGHHMFMVGEKMSIYKALDKTKCENAKKRLEHLLRKGVLDVVYPYIEGNDIIMEYSNDFYPFYYSDVVCKSYEEFVEQLKMSHLRFNQLTELIKNYSSD